MGSIALSDSLRVIGKERCWELQRLRIKNGQEVWEAFKYFATLGQAVAAASEREFRLAEGQA